MDIRQDEKTDIISNEAESAPLKVRFPTDPCVPMTALEGCRAPAYQGHRKVAKECYVLQGFTNDDSKSEIMVSVHERAPCFTFGGYDRADNESIKWEANLRGINDWRIVEIGCHKTLYTIPRGKAS